MEEFEVSKVSSKDEVYEYVLGGFQRLGWHPGKMDHELLWAAGPKGAGMYIGRLNGKRITAVGMFQHSDNYACVPYYFCEKEYRGRGFGFKTWKTARAALNSGVNISLDAVTSAIQLFEREGFKKAWESHFAYFLVSSICKAYGNMKEQDFGVAVKPATEVDFETLKHYVDDILGITYSHSEFLEKSITLPTHAAVAAVSSNGDIVGFAALRETMNIEKDGYRLGPFLADTGDIARLLVLDLANKVESAQKFGVYLLDATNTEADRMNRELGGSNQGWSVLTLVRMYTHGELPARKEKYYGLQTY